MGDLRKMANFTLFDKKVNITHISPR